MDDNFEINFDEFKSTEKKNTEVLNEVYEKEIKIFKGFFDVQLKLFQNHIHGFLDPYYSMEEYERIVMQSFFKTNHLLYTSLNLITKGNFGSANILLRQIFEFLIVGKYMCIVKNEKISEKWLNEGQFDIYDKVIRLMDKPDKKSFRVFWIMICKLAHATTVSHQVGLKAPSNSSQIYGSLVLVLLLQRLNYHLLSSCLINRKLIYRSEFYGGFKDENSSLKIKARSLKSEVFNLLSPEGCQLVKDYESKWSFKK